MMKTRTIRSICCPSMIMNHVLVGMTLKVVSMSNLRWQLLLLLMCFKKTNGSFDHYIVESSALHLSFPEFWLWHRWVSTITAVDLLLYSCLYAFFFYNGDYLMMTALRPIAYTVCSCAKNTKPIIGIELLTSCTQLSNLNHYTNG